MDPNGRRDKTRRIVIITLSAAIAGLTTALAASYERIGIGLAVTTGYIILFMSAALVNSFLHNSASDTKRMLCLVFSICVLLLFLGGMVYLLFNQKDDETIKPEITEEIIIPETVEEIEEETAEPDEIAIPSAPQVMWTVRIDDSSPHPVSEEPSDEISLQDEKSPRDSSETTAVIDSDNASSESAALIPEDPIFIGSMIRSIEDEIPSAPVFIEASVKAVEKDPAAIPDTPIFIEASINEVKKDETPVVPVIIGGADAETEIQIEEPAIEESTTETSSVSNNDFFSGLSPEEADFWADFYIAGEDELELADGIYYMDLYINDNYTGAITVQIINGETFLEVETLKTYLSGTITESAYSRIFNFATEAINLNDLENAGVSVEFDSTQYEIYLTFVPEDMPIQILSISGGRGLRRATRPIANGVYLDPAVFTLQSSYTLSARIDDFMTFAWWERMKFSFSSVNKARLYDVYLDFNYYMDFGFDYFSFDFSSYKFYVDFPDQMIRLQWGNVSSDLFSPSGTSVGIRFDKNYSYASSGYIRPSQYEQMIIVDTPSEILVLNEGREIFRKTLDIGTYRLRDFILYTGANKITVRIIPLDGSAIKEIDFDVLYAASLLAPGEVYYGASLVTGRKEVKNTASKLEGAFRIPIGKGKSLEYDLRDFVFSGYIRAGLLSNLTIDGTVAFQNKPTSFAGFRPNLKLALELTHANILGTTRYNFNVTERTTEKAEWEIPGFYASIGHQISTGWNGLSSISLGVNYSSPEETRMANRHRVAMNAGVSGRVGIMGWSLSASGGIFSDQIDASYWNLSASTNFTLSRNIWLSASMSLGGKVDVSPAVSGRISATIRFGKFGIDAAYGSNSNTYVKARYSDKKHSVSISSETYDVTAFNTYGFAFDYAYQGDYVDVSAGIDAGRLFSSVGANLQLRTSTLFADGVFALSSSFPANYVLIRQYGALKGNDISIGVAGSSSINSVKTSFGTAIYDGLSPSVSDSFTVFSNSDDSFSVSESYPINISGNRRNGYILRITAENKYSASGVVSLPNGMLWRNGASPLYRIKWENGSVETENTEDYIFTDTDGIFITPTLEPGLYGFDVPNDDAWILYVIEIVDLQHDLDKLQILDSGSIASDVDLPVEYNEMIFMRQASLLTSDEFFEMLYGGAAI